MEIEEIKNKLKEIEDMVNALPNKSAMEIKKIKDTIQHFISNNIKTQAFNVYITFKYCIINVFYRDINLNDFRKIIDILVSYKYYFNDIIWYESFCDIKSIKGEWYYEW